MSSRKNQKKIVCTVLSIVLGVLLSGCANNPFSALLGGNSGSPSYYLGSMASSMELGRSAFAKGNYGIAISHFEKELALRPESIVALNGLGASYDMLERFDVAQRYYFRALKLLPDSGITLANLGYSYHLQGKSRQAVPLLELALNVNADNKVVESNLQMIKTRLADNVAEETLAALMERTQSLLLVEMELGTGRHDLPREIWRASAEAVSLKRNASWNSLGEALASH